jgi:hypothetical protein
MFWGMGMSSIKEYLGEIKDINSVDLTLTKKCIEKHSYQEYIVN